MAGRVLGTEALPRELLAALMGSRREPKRPKDDDVRSANLRGVVCGLLAPVPIWEGAHNPKVAGSNPAPATMKDEGLADVEAANPFRLPRLHPGSCVSECVRVQPTRALGRSHFRGLRASANSQQRCLCGHVIGSDDASSSLVNTGANAFHDDGAWSTGSAQRSDTSWSERASGLGAEAGTSQVLTRARLGHNDCD